MLLSASRWLTPTNVARLCLSRELDISCNKLEALPPEVGKCIRLRKIRANGNYMEGIPTELGHCSLLEVCVRMQRMTGCVDATPYIPGSQTGWQVSRTLLVWLEMKQQQPTGKLRDSNILAYEQ